MRFRTICIYFAALAASLVLLGGISVVSGRLDREIKENNLRFTGEIANASPLVTFTTAALGSFRGIIADLLWFRAMGLQDKGNYFEMVQLAKWITDLQPTFSGGAAYLAWNMAYNISVTRSSFEDRWKWVNEGIKLLRDRALAYNPEDPKLYKELGWIFQHKIGNIMDDANLFYKNAIALEMLEVLGVNPDIPGMAAAPASAKEFDALYADNALLSAKRKEAGYSTFDELYEAFKANKAQLPEKFIGTLDDPEMAKKLENYFRRTYLRERFKLDAALLAELDAKYGRLDWRMPESQALYWATMGLKKTIGHRNLDCERMVTQALYESFKSGRLLFFDPKSRKNVIMVPNFDVLDAVKDTFDKTIKENPDVSSFFSAKVNFMKDAIVTLFTYGKFRKAAEYYEELKKIDSTQRRPSLEDFAMEGWGEDIRDGGVKQALQLISGMLLRSMYYAAYGDMDASAANDRMARYIYNRYQKENSDVQESRGLPPYNEMKQTIYRNAIANFPPEMAAALKARAVSEAEENKK
ncbi:MAG: hypothetical protein PHS41_00440 [Victivallaceae bacterium]|nr:hypothetical protein [Victivallaceae bacterium]